MIGNDIVDLSISHIGGGDRRVRYLAKIFVDSELDIIESLGNKDKWIWLLWSIKESVYKIVSRREQKIRYAPKTIRCISIRANNKEKYETIIDYQGENFVAVSELNNQFIHTIAATLDADLYQSISKAFTISSEENDTIDSKLISYLVKDLNYSFESISVIRDSLGVPHVYIDNQEKYLVSMSHHGGFGSFVLL